MSESRRDVDYLVDIWEAIERIFSYTADMSEEEFYSKRITQDAVIRNIEVIGEAAKYVSASFRQQHKEVPWKDLAGVRDKLIHQYFGVNLEIVWQIIHSDLPRLKPHIESLLNEINRLE